MPEPFIRVEGVALPLAIDNVDTDAIIPSKETQSVARTGYGEKLFANWRYLPGARDPNPAFVLNDPRYAGAKILISRRNFGCGSSREAAVWALQQFGVRAVVAESFGAIFRNNCIRNGVLPVTLPIEVVETLLDRLSAAATPGIVRVDLDACVVEGPDGDAHGFSIEARDRQMLLTGADEIALTLTHLDAINAFRAADRGRRPWIYRRSTD